MRRRRKATPETESAVEDGPPAADTDEQAGDTRSAAPRAQGPWDASEVPVDEGDETRAHLGSLSVQGSPDVELRLQVDEASGDVAAVMLVAADGAMELRAFAAPRHEDIWQDIRPRLAQEAERRGGSAADVEGPYGPALHMVVPAETPDGQQVGQPSTVLGIAGPRWLLRVSMFGRPAAQWQPDAPLERALRNVVVIRGDAPMAPGDPLPLVLPAQARRMDLPH